MPFGKDSVHVHVRDETREYLGTDRDRRHSKHETLIQTYLMLSQCLRRWTGSN